MGVYRHFVWPRNPSGRFLSKQINHTLPPSSNQINQSNYMCLFVSFLFFLPFRAAPEAYGSSQTRGRLELQLSGCATATATWDLSHICDLHHSSWQGQVFHPLSEARDWTCIFTSTNRVHFPWATKRTPNYMLLNWLWVKWASLGLEMEGPTGVRDGGPSG